MALIGEFRNCTEIRTEVALSAFPHLIRAGACSASLLVQGVEWPSGPVSLLEACRKHLAATNAQRAACWRLKTPNGSLHACPQQGAIGPKGGQRGGGVRPPRGILVKIIKKGSRQLGRCVKRRFRASAGPPLVLEHLYWLSNVNVVLHAGEHHRDVSGHSVKKCAVDFTLIASGDTPTHLTMELTLMSSTRPSCINS